jgi:hypothetical protein
VASILLLLLTAVVLVNLTPVQNYLAQKASSFLSEKLKTKVSVAHVRIDFLDHILLQGLYIEDQAHDTLLYAGTAQVRINDWFIFHDQTVLHYAGLQNTYIHIYRTAGSKVWNYDFIADALSSGPKKKEVSSKPFELDLKKIELENVRFHMDDKWGGEDEDYDVGSLVMNARKVDMTKRVVDISDITIKNAVVALNEYKAGHPPTIHNPHADTVDTTPFNPDMWSVKVKNLSVRGTTFRLTMDTLKAIPGEFDQDHLIVKNINIDVSNAAVVGDTIHGNIDNMTAEERCGINIRKMRTKVTVSPIASICENLYLETDYSKIQNYYAMHYKHFPSFTSYIDSVVMVGHLRQATVDMRDIDFFAPQLRSLPNITARVSGDGKGTVANLSAQHLSVTDGHTAIKGNVTMKGLPDIYKTYITFDDGEILTTGGGILNYAPSLKNSPNIVLEQLKFAYFKGTYNGYIEHFALAGTLNTNLGTIVTNIKMNIPGFVSNKAVYSGTLATSKVQLGTFIRQPLIGPITLNETISGQSFDPGNGQLNVNGMVSELTLNGYTYHNISTKGLLDKKQFNGSLLVDDPNLALEFDGGIDFTTKNIAVNATAHLLGSNFKAMNFTSDTLTASADFDLKCTGSNIDNFSGYAKLNNIDLRRNAHRLALDSIEVNSSGDTTNRLLTIQSNALVATIKGDYQLSKLPASVQYYLSRYLPNYIKKPEKYAPAQNLTFNVTTNTVDSIFAVTIPFIRGFDSSTFTGSLNTTAKKLNLSVNIPYGSIGMVHMSNIAISGQGNLDMIAINANIDNVALGDSMLNGSLSLTTTVENDSVGFTVATTSPDTSSSITLNGQIVARKDSLFLTLLPSQFFLNQAKWDIAGGSKVVYSDKYLLVQGLSLTSGLQKITAATQLANNDRSLVITTEDLDLGQLGSWAGLAAYQPDGRLNGTIEIDKIFQNLYVSTDLKATNVTLGTDTVGTISIAGTYDGTKKLVNLDPKTGIFRGDASVVASGNISFDSTTHQKLDGSIQFTNAPVVWASPFLAGILSRLSGTLNGSIAFDGSSYDPLLNGDVSLTNAGMRLDYLGCNYTIPAAKIHIDNKRIEFGKVQMFDAYKNSATLSGHFSHNLFKNMRMHLNIQSKKFEVMNLTSNDNNIFYGNLIAGMDSFTIRGPFNDIKLNVYNAMPAAKSRIYIPVSSGGDVGTYSYVTFKTYGKNQDKLIRKAKEKITINVDANLNDLAEMNLVLDPSTGDGISANGEGHITLEIPPDNDIRITGNYNINDGVYTYTFKQLLFIRQFNLVSGSTISFGGPFSATRLDVNAIYPVKARLYDLLTDYEIKSMAPNDATDAQTLQTVDVKLNMKGYLNNPVLTFDLDLEDKHSQSTFAYQRLMQINADAQQKFDQVAALLLIKSFIPPEGIGTGAVATGAINNLSQVLSGTASTGLTNIVNKLTGEKQLNIDVRYNNYNYADASGIAANRSQVKLDVSKNLFSDRLILEAGTTSDWGHPANTSTSSSFNFTGDFRIQYLLSHASPVRLNAFRTSDYDVTLDRDIIRSGLGITWRKSFDNFNEFFHGNKYARKITAAEEKAANLLPAQDTTTKGGGTE